MIALLLQSVFYRKLNQIHMKHIAPELEMPKPDSTHRAHVKMLLSESFRNRREYIASMKPEDWGCILVHQCLCKLIDIGVWIESITCDGPSCHVTMLETLVYG